MTTTKKDRIMDLMRRGIITESEAVELLEKADSTAGEEMNPSEKIKVKKEKTFTDDEGYTNQNVDFGDAMKNIFQGLADKSKDLFKSASKTVNENIDFANGFPKVKSISKEIEKDLEGEFNAVKIDIKAGIVTVKPGENAHVKAEYKVYGAVEGGDVDAYLAEKTKLEVEDGTLVISTEASMRTALNLELYLPEKAYQAFELSLAHGDVKVTDLEVDDFKISQINGRVELTGNKAEKLEVSNKNGEIKVLDGSAKILKLDQVNGNIKVTATSEDSEIGLVNGDILLTLDENARNLNAKSVNGDVKVSFPESLGLVGHVKTVFGGYKTRIKLDNPLETGRNGAALVRTGDQTLTFEIETKSGTIWLKDSELTDTEVN